MDTNYIIERYKSGELTLEQANAELAATGAGYYLKPLTDEERSEKAAKEYEEGTIDIGRKPNPLPEKADLGRYKERAGLQIIQATRHGKFLVTYDADGYAVKSERI